MSAQTSNNVSVNLFLLGIGWEFPASGFPFGGGTVGLIGSMASRGADRSPAEKNFGAGLQLVQMLCHDSRAGDPASHKRKETSYA
jgi:hypothetical protein